MVYKIITLKKLIQESHGLLPAYHSWFLIKSGRLIIKNELELGISPPDHGKYFLKIFPAVYSWQSFMNK